MWQTIGHSRQKQHLDLALEKNSLSHAYIFSGPAKVGKRTLAIEFAGKIFSLNGGAAGVGMSNTNPATNPDLLIYNSSFEHTSIAAMRELASKLSLKPYRGDRIVVIVDNFESVSNEAASSILKTLEEPNASVVLILVCANRRALLPTIVSRSQLVNFGRLGEDDLLRAFPKNQPADRSLVASVDGKIGELLDLLRDKALLQLAERDSAAIDALKREQLPARILAVKKFAELDADQLQAMFQRWLSREHSAMVSGAPEAFRNVRAILDGMQQLDQNVNKKFALEKIFMNLA
jgi:DNA polymerase-3 subunit delta'